MKYVNYSEQLLKSTSGFGEFTRCYSSFYFGNLCTQYQVEGTIFVGRVAEDHSVDRGAYNLEISRLLEWGKTLDQYAHYTLESCE